MIQRYRRSPRPPQARTVTEQIAPYAHGAGVASARWACSGFDARRVASQSLGRHSQSRRAAMAVFQSAPRRLAGHRIRRARRPEPDADAGARHAHVHRRCAWSLREHPVGRASARMSHTTDGTEPRVGLSLPGLRIASTRRTRASVGMGCPTCEATNQDRSTNRRAPTTRLNRVRPARESVSR